MKSKPEKVMARDGEHLSPWQRNQLPKAAGRQQAEKIYDCLVIGAGITGVTAALMLQEAGTDVLLVDAITAGFGTTGGTSSHINTFADTTYKEAAGAFGKEGAQLFAGAVNAGFDIIRQNIANYQIDCDYRELPGYVFAETEEDEKILDEVYEGCKEVGVKIGQAEDIPVKIPFRKAVILDGQAQFDPLKYLKSLLDAFTAAGGTYLDNTRIEKIQQEDDVHVAQSDERSLRAKKVVYATHIPPGVNVFSFRCAPYRSYVIGVKLQGDNYPDALVYDVQDPYHYIRTHEIDGEKIVLIGGNDHKTGHDDPSASFAGLEKYANKYFPVSSVKYRWSSQYYVPVDGLPYVGQIPFMAAGIYTATGYNGNGMMLGSISGQILSYLVTDKQHPYADLFSSSRLKPIDGFTEFVKENADVAYHFVADRLSIAETDSLKRIKPGTGKVLKFEGRKVAAYRDEDGEVHALNPTCTHAGCIVNWNPEEKSWDCPCHGGRFDPYGKVLNGPTDRDLEKY